jgi:hypothetical protein
VGHGLHFVGIETKPGAARRTRTRIARSDTFRTRPMRPSEMRTQSPTRHAFVILVPFTGQQRTTSATHQFLMFRSKNLRRADCPKGWMSPMGHVRYLKITLAKMRQRQVRSKKAD